MQTPADTGSGVSLIMTPQLTKGHRFESNYSFAANALMKEKLSQPVKLSLSQTPIFGAASSMTDGPLGGGSVGALTAVLGEAILKVLKSRRSRQMLSLAGQTVYSHTVGLDREVGEVVGEVVGEDDR
jgi:hypothetical protein